MRSPLLILVATVLLLSSCLSGRVKPGWFDARAADLCDRRKTDAPEWRKLKEWQGVPQPRYVEMQDRRNACEAEMVNTAQDLKNVAQHNYDLAPMFDPRITDTLATIGLVCIVIGGIVATNGAAAPTLVPILLKLVAQ